MIGSHDTFTYLQPANPIYRLFTRLWRTQCKTIDEQYATGVRFFDLRVVRHRGRWYFAHGIVRLKGLRFKTIDDICRRVDFCFPDAIYRIVLERGSSADETAFLNETYGLSSVYCNLWRLDIKSEKSWFGDCGNNNPSLYSRGYNFAQLNTWESPSHELTGHVTKHNWYNISLKKEAQKTNSSLSFFKSKDKLLQMQDSKAELYLLDYCTNEYK